MSGRALSEQTRGAKRTDHVRGGGDHVHVHANDHRTVNVVDVHVGVSEFVFEGGERVRRAARSRHPSRAVDMARPVSPPSRLAVWQRR